MGFVLAWGYLVGVTWIYVSLHDFGAMPSRIALIILCAYLAIFPALSIRILAGFRLASPFVWASFGCAMDVV